MVIVVDNEEIDELPSGLSQFFQDYPSICEANEALTSIEHVNMWRDNVLFIKQRQQATSDYRENPKVRWIGNSTECRWPLTRPVLQALTLP